MTNSEFKVWLDLTASNMGVGGLEVFKMPTLASIGFKGILESLDRYAVYANDFEARYYTSRIEDDYLTMKEAIEIKETLEQKQKILFPNEQFVNWFKIHAA